MEPFGVLGVAASIISCVQLTGALLKRAGVGPSDHSKKDLNGILKTICGFSGAHEGLKTILLLRMMKRGYRHFNIWKSHYEIVKAYWTLWKRD